MRVFATPKLPQIQFSVNTNYCDIGFSLAEDGRRLVVVSCIDNLLKGAAGQAVQNMNLMYGCNEAGGPAVKIVVKIGGAALEDKATLHKCARASLSWRATATRSPWSTAAAQRSPARWRCWARRAISSTAFASPTPKPATWL